MRKLFLTLMLLAFVLCAGAQRKYIDTLRTRLNHNLDDSTHIQTLLDLGHAYYLSNPDSNIILSQQAYVLAEKDKRLAQQSRALNNMATGYASLGDYPKAAQMFYRALRISEDLHDGFNISRIYSNLGDTYMRQRDYRRALISLSSANKQWHDVLATRKTKDRTFIESGVILSLNIGESYLGLNKIDSAEYYLQESYKEGKKLDDVVNNIYRDFGEVEIARGHTDKALKYLSDAIQTSKAIDDKQMLSESYLSEAKLYHNNKQQDSAEFYGQKALDVASAGKFEQDVLNAGKVLYAYYDEDHNLPLAYKYYRMAMAAKDSIYSQDRVKQLLSLDFEEKQRQKEIATAQEQYRASVRMYLLIAGMVVLVILAFIFWRANKARTKAYNLLRKQKEEIDFQKAKVEHTLTELKSTQNQLVQSAKMASLGELTAGIAHEIQNPLNFVNNFSEVTAELTGELKEELKNGNTKEAMAIADDIEQNAQKIRHHGKRADFIVKGMLEHSRNSTGERQVTNINVLAEEFLKLSYHGLRAKDKDFNADFVTDFDPNLPKINVVQQDIWGGADQPVRQCFLCGQSES